MHMHRTKCERNSSLGGTIITWSEVAKQNIQAKKVYCLPVFSFSVRSIKLLFASFAIFFL